MGREWMTALALLRGAIPTMLPPLARLLRNALVGATPGTGMSDLETLAATQRQELDMLRMRVESLEANFRRVEERMRALIVIGSLAVIVASLSLLVLAFR